MFFPDYERAAALPGPDDERTHPVKDYEHHEDCPASRDRTAACEYDCATLPENNNDDD